MHLLGALLTYLYFIFPKKNFPYIFMRNSSISSFNFLLRKYASEWMSHTGNFHRIFFTKNLLKPYLAFFHRIDEPYYYHGIFNISCCIGWILLSRGFFLWQLNNPSFHAPKGKYKLTEIILRNYHRWSKKWWIGQIESQSWAGFYFLLIRLQRIVGQRLFIGNVRDGVVGDHFQ